MQSLQSFKMYKTFFWDNAQPVLVNVLCATLGVLLLSWFFAQFSSVLSHLLHSASLLVLEGETSVHSPGAHLKKPGQDSSQG